MPTRCPAATLAELNKFCAAVCASQYPRHIRPKYRTIYWRAFLGALYFTGLRLGDVEGLKWNQVGEEEITIVAQKTGKCQTIPIHPVLRKLLDLIRDTPVADWKSYPGRWRTRDTEPKRRERVFAHSRKLTHHAFWNIRKASGLPKFSAQCVRKLAARQYEAAHGGAGGILLGHSLGVTGFYLSSVEILRTAQLKLAIPDCFADLAPKQPDLSGIFAGLTAQQQQVVLSILATMGVKA